MYKRQEEEAAFFEEVQRELIAILQDRTKPIGVRVDEYQMCIRDRNCGVISFSFNPGFS